MDKQYLNDEFNRFFEFTPEDKSQVSSVSAKLFAEHIAYPLEYLIEKQAEEINALRKNNRSLTDQRFELMERVTRVCAAKLNGDFGPAEAMKNIENILLSGESGSAME